MWKMILTFLWWLPKKQQHIQRGEIPKVHLPYQSSSSFSFLATEFKRISLHISTDPCTCALNLNDQGLFFFLMRFLERGSFCIRYKRDISLRRFPHEFLRCSVKCGWVNLGNPNHVQVLLEAFWGSAALSGSSPVVHTAQVVIWRDGKHALPWGKSGDGRNSLHLCKIPRGFSADVDTIWWSSSKIFCFALIY